jgi:hypothetical protein
MAVDVAAIEADIWLWMREFVSVRNEFYGSKFAPCPYAQRALTLKTVDVVVWASGNFREFVGAAARAMQDQPHLTTRVIALPPRAQDAWGFTDFVESLNAELIPHNVFLNTGVAKTTTSRYPGSAGKPYFMVVANGLQAVLQGAEQLQRTDYYQDWPANQVDIVVGRRARLAALFLDRADANDG